MTCGIEHVMVDPATLQITRIIDWSDAAVADSAYDFGLIYRDLGPTMLDVAIRHYQSHAATQSRFRERAAFYAKCTVLEDMAYGLDTDREQYVKKSIAAMDWLF
jgi:aminoglycoside phosphotransferase (APT) family kinase protein